MYVIWIWRDDEQRWRKHASEFPLGQSDAACTAGERVTTVDREILATVPELQRRAA